VLLVAGCAVWKLASPSLSVEHESTLERRSAEDTCVEGEPDTLTPTISTDGQEWMVIFYFLGIMYMFVALAIVCDEFFVPALEAICSADHLDLPDDIAGATFMAAGGSAPELFTSFIGTMQDSAVGFGTIVGSAVFNVLFVVAMCSFFALSELQLTWWPLARDCTYYAFGLCVLAVFFAGTSEGVIEWWEALVLLSLYGGYVTLMAYNPQLQAYFDPEGYKKSQIVPEDEGDEGDAAAAGGAPLSSGSHGSVEDTRERATSHHGLLPPVWDGVNDKGSDTPDGPAKEGSPSLEVVTSDSAQNDDAAPNGVRKLRRGSTVHPHDFRQGMLSMLTSSQSMFAMNDVATRVLVSYKGGVREAFEAIDTKGNGSIGPDELRQLFRELDVEVTDEQLQDAVKELDANADGRISFEEFSAWYASSEERLQAEMSTLLDKYDVDDSGCLDAGELEQLVMTLFNHRDIDCSDVHDALDHLTKDGRIDRAEFTQWYKHSSFFEEAKSKLEEEADESIWDWPEDSCSAQFWFVVTLPLAVALTYTVPKCDQKGEIFGIAIHKWCWYSFGASIFWIGIFSLFMVDWTMVAGDTIGVPAEVMGLTFLAAGTSVPDLLSSIIVAMQGKGDMAISSSIGSNIFDILIGLPVPWLVYTAVKSKPFVVTAETLQLDIMLLLGMLVAVVGIIAANGWRLTKTLGIMMVALYFLFLLQSILNNKCLVCTGGCFS